MFISRLISDQDGNVQFGETEFVTWEQFDALLAELALQTGAQHSDSPTAQTQVDLAGADHRG